MKLPTPRLVLCLIGVAASTFALWQWRRSAKAIPATGPSMEVTRTKTLRERVVTALADTDRTRSARFVTVFEQLTAETAAALAPELLAHEKSSPFQNDWYDFLRRWTELDPAAAMAFAQANARSGFDDWAFIILPAGAKMDRNAALGWLSNFTGSSRERIAASIIGDWAKHNWQAVAKWIDANNPGIDQATLAAALAAVAVAAAPSAVRAKIDGRIASGGSRSAVEKALFLRLASQRLQLKDSGTLPWIASAGTAFPIPLSMAKRCERSLVVDIEYSSMSNEDRGAWLTWLQGPFESERWTQGLMDETRYMAQSGVALFSSWLASDAQSASEWLGRQSDRAWYDKFTVELVLDLARESPDTATETAEAWGMTVKSSSARMRICLGLQQMGLKSPAGLAAIMRAEGEGYLLDIPPRLSVETGPVPE